MSVAFVANLAEGKVYSQCEVAAALRNKGVPEDQVATWVCIAHAESNFDTTAINKNTWDYGIFQISSLYWCESGDSPGMCFAGSFIVFNFSVFQVMDVT